MKRVPLVIPLSVILVACGSAAPTLDIPAIQTQAARDVIATITALVPTPTLPPTATMIPTPTPDISAIQTQAAQDVIATITALAPSPTLPPTPTETPAATPIQPSPAPTPIPPTFTPTSTPLATTVPPTEVPPTNTPPPPTGWDCSGDLYNCGDFSSCEEVMDYFRACPGDPSRLDGDKDGVPCESLCK